MPRFGQISKTRLESCHPDLQRLFRAVVRGFDCIVLCGHRTKEQQAAAFARGNSRVKWPHSKHNNQPSLAVDVAPYPIDWSDTHRFYFFGGYVKAIADVLDIPLRWGGDWDGDTEVKDQHFMDLVHFELRMA